MTNLGTDELMRSTSIQSRAGLWSLADQGAVSLGNFLTNILLARALPPAEYGIFALVFGLLLVLSSIHAAVVIYPLSIRAAASDSDDLRRYASRSLLLTGLLFLPLAAVVFGAAEFLGRQQVGLWAIAALLCWLVQETMRRALMAHLRHGEAVWGDILSYVGQAGIIFLCIRSGRVPLELVFGIIAATSILAAAFQASQLRLGVVWKRGVTESVSDFWDVGRWALAANGAVALSSLAFPWFLALRGTEMTASFQALVSLFGVTNPIILGISNLIVPATAGVVRRDGIRAAWRVASNLGIRGAALLLPYYLVIALWPRFLLRLFYGPGSPYLAQGMALRLLVIGYCVAYVFQLLAAVFYGLGQSKHVLKVQSAGAAAAILLGFPLVFRFGVPGASGAFTLVCITQAATCLWLLVKAQSVIVSNTKTPRTCTDEQMEAVEPARR
jgi:O-antigen/teichoic acid export membrane protein